MSDMKTWTRPDDKAKLPAGLWQDEPDKAVWVDEVTGLDCMANRNPLGAWCGYVGVGPDHPLHGVGYSQHIAECPKGDPDDCWDWDCPTPEGRFDVHGGLTYADACQPSENPAQGICHVPEPGRTHDVWWFGFDCAHGGDLVPTMAEHLPPSLCEGATYKDVAYVRCEVERLARQMAPIPRRNLDQED